MTPLCAQDGVDPTWFDLEASPAAHDRAKRICADCSLTAQCRVQAVTDEMSGVWAGQVYASGLLSGQRRSDLTRLETMHAWADSTVAAAVARARSAA